jgi:predicted permease
MYVSTYLELAARQRSFESLALYSGGGILRTDARGVQADASVEGATPGYHAMLGIHPLLGRLISSADAPDQSDSAPVVVLGYRFWRRQFGGDPRVLSETVRIEGIPLTVIGILPPEFHGLYVDQDADVTVPLAALRQIAGDPKRPIRALSVIGRLAPGVTLSQARAELAMLWPLLRTSTTPVGLTAAEDRDMRASQIGVQSVANGFSSLRTRYADPILVVVGLTTLLLMIGSINVSGLLLARAIARGPELAMRVMLGASRARLIQQLVVESLILAVAGTVVSLPMASWGSHLLSAMLWSGQAVPLALSVAPDARVWMLAAASSVAGGVVIGVLPAWRATGRHGSLLLQTTRNASGSSGVWRKALVVAQVSLSLVLLVGAGLLARSVANLRANDAAFSKRSIIWARLWLNPGVRQISNGATYYSELTRQISQLGGVESVGLSYLFPTYFGATPAPQVIGEADVSDASGDVPGIMEVVSPGFFKTIGIGLADGRDFSWRDDEHGAAVAIVNGALARRLFPKGDALRRRIKVGNDRSRQHLEIVGIVQDAPMGNIRRPDMPVAFRPLAQESQYARVPVLNVRVDRDLKSINGITDGLRRIIAPFNRHFIRDARTLDEAVNQSLLQERLVAAFANWFAGLAVLVSCIGLYGSLAYTVTRRTREIGVRMALGATRASVLRMIAREGTRLALLGVAIGIPCALAAGRLIRFLLYGLPPSDPTTLIAASSVFVMIAITAGLLPAYRASTIDPITALRQD